MNFPLFLHIICLHLFSNFIKFPYNEIMNHWTYEYMATKLRENSWCFAYCNNEWCLKTVSGISQRKIFDYSIIKFNTFLNANIKLRNNKQMQMYIQTASEKRNISYLFTSHRKFKRNTDSHISSRTAYTNLALMLDKCIAILWAKVIISKNLWLSKATRKVLNMIFKII